jgi:hypothetical protein
VVNKLVGRRVSALGFMTPDGALATLEESNASPAAFIRRMTNDGNPNSALTPAGVNGQPWHFSSTPSRDQRSQLRELAAALYPVAR